MNTRRKKKIGMVSLGCAKNLVDTEVLMKQLEFSQFDVVFEPESETNLDSVIINTCGFIGDAKKESIDVILHFVAAKKAGKIHRLLLMGCLTERYRAELKQEIPEADGIYGVHELQKILSDLGGEYCQNLLGERHLTSPGHYAYLKIAEGCDRRCSFCAIPMIRGPHRSKPMDEVIRETSMLAAKGVKELLVISQDTTFYGVDIYGRRKLAELLRRLSNVKGVEWIRLHYTYPHAFPIEVLEVMKDVPNICNYIDIPLQHISSHILRSMKRGMNGDKTKALIETIRSRVPGIAIRTTFITGYPGETEQDFEDLCKFIKESRFDRLGAFAYSNEEGTAAALGKDNIPSHIKQKRLATLMKIQEEISLQLNQSKIGQIMKVIIDAKEEEYWIGRTEADSPEVDQEIVIHNRGETLNPGEFCYAKICEAGYFDLHGEVAL
ncbi:MAG: 30S ribosomal protein S12 methylthiotransferase RimO [bacterium]